MNDSTDFLLIKNTWNHIQNLLGDDSIDIFISAEWGARQPGGKEKLHQNISANLTEFTFSSISHCTDFGGYFISKLYPVGFDIEQLERTTEKVVGRISTQVELQDAPHPGCLWSAKEACFKSLRGHHQPSVLSEITIKNWNKIVSIQDACIYSFTAMNSISPLHIESCGAVIQSSSHVYAFYSLKN